MSRRISIALALLTMLVTQSALIAEEGADKKKKGVALVAKLFAFSPQAYALEPGIDSVLLLTDDQKEKLAAAYAETVGQVDLKALGAKAKDKNTTDADRKAAMAELKTKTEAAQSAFKSKIDSILTAEQKATIKKVDDAVKGALEASLSAEQKEALAKTHAKGKK
jgi:hypothetical protein